MKKEGKKKQRKEIRSFSVILVVNASSQLAQSTNFEGRKKKKEIFMQKNKNIEESNHIKERNKCEKE